MSISSRSLVIVNVSWDNDGGVFQSETDGLLCLLPNPFNRIGTNDS